MSKLINDIGISKTALDTLGLLKNALIISICGQSLRRSKNPTLIGSLTD